MTCVAVYSNCILDVFFCGCSVTVSGVSKSFGTFSQPVYAYNHTVFWMFFTAVLNKVTKRLGCFDVSFVYFH